MATVEVEALRWVDEVDFPRIVQLRLTDAFGEAHLIVDKETVFSPSSIEVPGRLGINCSVDSVDGERVTVTLHHSVASEGDRSTFVVVRSLVAEA